MPTDLPQTSDQLQQMRERLEAAENAFDPEPIVHALADDAVLMVPDVPAREGRDACADFIRAICGWQRENLQRHITYVSAEVGSMAPDIAFDRGTFAFDVTVKASGEQSRVTGKYFWLYSRDEAGAWKLMRLIMCVDDEPVGEGEDGGYP